MSPGFFFATYVLALVMLLIPYRGAAVLCKPVRQGQSYMLQQWCPVLLPDACAASRVCKSASMGHLRGCLSQLLTKPLCCSAYLLKEDEFPFSKLSHSRASLKMYVASRQLQYGLHGSCTTWCCHGGFTSLLRQV